MKKYSKKLDELETKMTEAGGGRYFILKLEQEDGSYIFVRGNGDDTPVKYEDLSDFEKLHIVTFEYGTWGV